VISIWLHWLELFSTKTPTGYVALLLGAIGGATILLSASMIGRRAINHWNYSRKIRTNGTVSLDKASISAFSYKEPWLLRTSESPAWRGWLIVGGGLAVLGLLTWGVDPRLKTWAIRHELAKGGNPKLVEMQARWAELHASEEHLGDVLPIPFDQDHQAIAATAGYIQSKQRTIEGIGFLCLLLGLGYALRVSTRESLGPKHHGQAAFATRNEIVYDKDGGWALPIRVDQRGSRDYERVTDAPFTVVRLPLTSRTVHFVGIGNAGSGKGAYLAGHIFKTDPNPICYFDYKGEMPAYTLRPQMLRWGFPSERPKGLPSLRLNLVDWTKNHEDPDAAAKILASAVLPENSKKESDNAWIKQTAIPILAQGFLMGRWSNLAELADEVEHTPLMELLENIEVGRGRASAFLGRNVCEYAQNEISNNTAAYLSGRARHIVTSSDFTLDEAFQRGLYVMGQAGSPSERRVLTTLWNVFWAELLRKGDAMPLTVLVDEGVACGPVPRVEEALVTLRDRGISLIQFFQTRAGLTSVYGRDLADSVWDAHQSHIFLTKGLAVRDIETVVKLAGRYTKPGSKRDDKPTPADLLPFDEFKNHCRQEKYWAVIDGVGWSKSGRPVLAELQPIPRSGWNWRATREEYDAQLALLEYGTEWPSPYRMSYRGVVEATKEVGGKTQTYRFHHWVPTFPEAAARKGVTEKHVVIDGTADLYRQLSRKEIEADPVEAAYGKEKDQAAAWDM